MLLMTACTISSQLIGNGHESGNDCHTVTILHVTFVPHSVLRFGA